MTKERLGLNSVKLQELRVHRALRVRQVHRVLRAILA
jgi:hypothetical protein